MSQRVASVLHDCGLCSTLLGLPGLLARLRSLSLLAVLFTGGCAWASGVQDRIALGAFRPVRHVDAARSKPSKVALSPGRRPATISRPTIEFFEFYKYGSGGPMPKPKLLRLNGNKVTLVGYMVQMESPPRGGFYIAPYPAGCDDLGTVRRGLPHPSVLVLPPAARGKHVDFIEGSLEVTGILDVGKKESADGEVARIRLVLDGPGGLKFARSPSMARADQPHRKKESQ